MEAGTGEMHHFDVKAGCGHAFAAQKKAEVPHRAAYTRRQSEHYAVFCQEGTMPNCIAR